jgi:hypothetical protein
MRVLCGASMWGNTGLGGENPEKYPILFAELVPDPGDPIRILVAASLEVTDHARAKRLSSVQAGMVNLQADPVDLAVGPQRLTSG